MNHTADRGPIALVVAMEAELRHLLEAVGSVHEKHDGVRLQVSELVCDPELVQAAHEAAAYHMPPPWPQDLHWPVAVPYRGPVIHTGAIASADIWTQSPTRLDLLHRRHESLCEDMEAAAVAQVCALHGVPFLTIKDISNNEFHTATDITGGLTNFPRAEAGRRATALILRLIERLAAYLS